MVYKRGGLSSENPLVLTWSDSVWHNGCQGLTTARNQDLPQEELRGPVPASGHIVCVQPIATIGNVAGKPCKYTHVVLNKHTSSKMHKWLQPYWIFLDKPKCLSKMYKCKPAFLCTCWKQSTAPNCTARLILRASTYQHTSTLLKQSHWFPIPAHILSKHNFLAFSHQLWHSLLPLWSFTSTLPI